MLSLPPPSRFAGILLDFDGVLADSMPRHFEAYRRVLEPLGIEIEFREIALQEGRRSYEIIEEILRSRKRRGDPFDLARKKQEIFLSLGKAPLFPQVPSILKALRQAGYRVVVVTGTLEENVREHLGDLGDLLEGIVSAKDVSHSKPDPEPYLKAMEIGGVPPYRSLAVENAPLGIESARRAGATVAALPTTLPPQDLKKAHVLLPSLSHISELLGGGIP